MIEKKLEEQRQMKARLQVWKWQCLLILSIETQ